MRLVAAAKFFPNSGAIQVRISASSGSTTQASGEAIQVGQGAQALDNASF
jgi:hypothetical protein